MNNYLLLMPGILFSTTLGSFIFYFSQWADLPLMLLALIIGMCFNFINNKLNFSHGISFTSKKFLRIGIALLGLRFTINDIQILGWSPFFLILIDIILVISFSIILCKFYKLDTKFGIICGGATGICGASAALAISSVLPSYKKKDNDTAFTVIAVTALSTVAMIIYPIIFEKFNFSQTQLGIIFGSSIHDVAQVIGAGFSISEKTGDIATYTKLLRVCSLPFLVILIAVLSSKNQSKNLKETFPLFAIFFLILLLVNSFFSIPANIVEILITLSKILLTIAVVSLGMKTSITSLVNCGIKPLLIIIKISMVIIFIPTLWVTFINI